MEGEVGVSKCRWSALWCGVQACAKRSPCSTPPALTLAVDAVVAARVVAVKALAVDGVVARLGVVASVASGLEVTGGLPAAEQLAGSGHIPAREPADAVHTVAVGVGEALAVHAIAAAAGVLKALAVDTVAAGCRGWDERGGEWR